MLWWHCEKETALIISPKYCHYHSPMIYSAIYCLLIFLAVCLFTRAFQPFALFGSRQIPAVSTNLHAQQQDNNKGYQFGDITKGLLKKASSAVNQVTGKDEYTFGDLSRWADARVKQRINNITGEDEYEFGALSKWADAQVKTQIANYTGKEDYVVGDVSQEIIRRVSTGEYATEDLVLLCKALVTFGVGLSPVARFLPAKLLLEMIKFGLVEEVGGRFMGALSTTLDQRFKETLTGDANYRIGDKTKQAIQNLMAVANEQDTTTTSSSVKSTTAKEVMSDGEMDSALIAELQDWDRRLGIAGNNDKSTGDGSPIKSK